LGKITKNPILIVGLISVVVCATIVAYLAMNQVFTTSEPEVEVNGTYQKFEDTSYAVVAAVTGLNFYKSKDTQSVSFYNDENNHYAEKITIYLPNGSVVYTSDYLQPGERVNEIKTVGLTDPGIYDGLIVYTFYTLDKHNFVSRLETSVEIRYIE